jgi:hypothetical protein
VAHKELRFNTEARRALEAGVNKLADAVRITLGPKGQYVVLDKKFGSPTITNDGVTIAREIELEDIFENQGAQLVKEVATKTTSSGQEVIVIEEKRSNLEEQLVHLLYNMPADRRPLVIGKPEPAMTARFTAGNNSDARPAGTPSTSWT